MADITSLSDDELRQMRSQHLQSMSDDELKAMRGPRQPSETFARGAGLIGKGLIQGAADVPLMVTDAPLKVARAFGYKGGQTGSEALHQWLSKGPLKLPEAENTAERITENVSEAVPSMGVGSMAQGATALSDIGRNLMQRALKPTMGAQKRGDAAVAIDTMLEKGFNVSKGGIEKLRGEIDSLNQQISDKIANSTEVVDKAAAGKYLNQLMEKFKNQVNPGADVEAIHKAWDEFKNHPAWQGGLDMAVQAAQSIKKGTYDQLRKKYGQMGTADVESQKALARGLKDEISAKVPEVGPLNAQDSKLIKTLGVAERQQMQQANKDPGSFAWLAHSPVSFAAYMADKSSLFKSMMANILYRGGSIPLGSIGGAAGINALQQGTDERDVPLSRIGH